MVTKTVSGNEKNRFRRAWLGLTRGSNKGFSCVDFLVSAVIVIVLAAIVAIPLIVPGPNNKYLTTYTMDNQYVNQQQVGCSSKTGMCTIYGDYPGGHYPGNGEHPVVREFGNHQIYEEGVVCSLETNTCAPSVRPH